MAVVVRSRALLRLRAAPALRRQCAQRPRAAASTVPAEGATPRNVIVVGGGAAGLTAAFFAAASGARVDVLERNAEAGKKILMSGGTRANVLPLAYDTDADFFTDGNRALLRRVLASWPLEGVKRWLELDVGVPLSLEVETGKFFPSSNSGRSVRDALVAAAQRSGAVMNYRASVESLAPRAGGGWTARCADGRVFVADAVVLASVRPRCAAQQRRLAG